MTMGPLAYRQSAADNRLRVWYAHGDNPAAAKLANRAVTLVCRYVRQKADVVAQSNFQSFLRRSTATWASAWLSFAGWLMMFSVDRGYHAPLHGFEVRSAR